MGMEPNKGRVRFGGGCWGCCLSAWEGADLCCVKTRGVWGGVSEIKWQPGTSASK